MLKRRALVLTAAALLAVTSCNGRQYLYLPVESTSATIAGRTASYYRIPEAAPQGDVRIATFGIVEIEPEGEDDELSAIHVRMVVTNESDVPWTVDTREQRIVLPRHGESRPAYASVDGGSPPVVQVPARGRRTFDLFYPLPETMQKAAELPSFDTVWRVTTSAGTVAEDTPFERIDVTPVYEPYPYYGYYGYGGYYGPAWGPPYYYDPWYPRAGFIGAPVWVHRPVDIRPPPARRVR